MKRKGIRSAIALAGLTLGVACAGYYPARVGIGVTYIVRTPPPERVEVISVAPSPAHVWISGYWAWQNPDYIWVPGRWERPAPGHRRWEPGRWRHDHKGWYWVDGRWR